MAMGVLIDSRSSQTMGELYPGVAVGQPRVLSLPFCMFLVFLSIAFFLLTQDFFHSVLWQNEGLTTVDEISAHQEVSVLRRAILLSLGSLASVSLLRRTRNKLRI